MRLGELVTIGKGRKPQQVSSEAHAGYRRLIQIEDLRPGAVPRFCPASKDELGVVPDDLVIAWDGANAGTVSSGLCGVIGSTLAVLRPKAELVHTSYLTHFLRSRQRYLRSRCKGATVPHIDGAVLESLDVPLPSLSEQRRVADVLDRSEALLELRRASVDAIRSLPDSVFTTLFGDETRIQAQWPLAKLGDLLDFLTSGSRGWAAFYGDRGELFLRVQNVGRDELLLADVAFVKAPATAEAQRTRVRPGDVLLSITADLGRTAVIPPGFGPAYINQHLSILRTSRLVPRFLAAYLASPAGQHQIAARNRHGVKAGLNFDDIRSLLIPVPPQELQCELVRRLDAVERLRQAVIESQRVLDELSASLRARAFNRPNVSG